ncbi:type I restriction enzyme HsdR N-terminal domain-containing protein (plasmid) [Entomospira entomophila]|nr:type I restriction endonuclease [Entomospira entomophilus]WDI36385.1 type I restriction enzyme HsdR N-terminal domain-containing protein [Entomospira entomophilus]
MAFSDELYSLGKKYKEYEEAGGNEGIGKVLPHEEAIKAAIIRPFIKILGYDTANPLEVMPEYTADVPGKKGEKVDFAIMNQGNPILLVECKKAEAPLNKHSGQLFRYFTTEKAKFALLTNGKEYRFFTDLDEDNKMDVGYFLVADITQLNEDVINDLKRFRKETFNQEALIQYAERSKYLNLLKEKIKEDFENPEKDFVSLLYSRIKGPKVTDKRLPAYSELVKTAWIQILNENFNARIARATMPEVEPSSPLIGNSSEKKLPETTEEELAFHRKIMNLLKADVETKDITYRDGMGQFSILWRDNRRQPLVHLIAESSTAYRGEKMIILYPVNIETGEKEEEKIVIKSIDEIKNYKDILLQTIRLYHP